MIIVNIVAREGYYIPSSKVTHTALHIAEAVHADGDVACTHCHAATAIGSDGGEDICRGVELTSLSVVGLAQVGLDEFLHHVGLLEVGIVGIDNRPPECAYHLLHVLVEQLLDPIREEWGEPIVVPSGYRCKELNALVGGAKNSHHLLGCAADLIAGSKADHRRLFKLIQQMQQQGQIRFIQLIWEGNGRWIHISYVPSDLRCQVIAYG